MRERERKGVGAKGGEKTKEGNGEGRRTKERKVEGRKVKSGARKTGDGMNKLE